ncbi:MAG: CotH kinase family protein, partial [Bryobacteraceae bacterium]
MKSTDITLLARRVILAATLVLAMTPITAKAQTPAQLFDDVVLQDIYLFMDPADWQKLRDNYLLDTYYPARFVWNGIELGRVGIRSRGSGSRSPEKPNLLVAFNRYDSNQKLFGLASVVLKANNQDASLLREVLAMKLFRRIGLPAPLEAPARLYVNGELFNAYTLVESIDEVFLARNFGEDTGYLYDWQENRDQGYHFEYLGPDPSLYVPAPWDPKTRKSSPDAAFIEAMVRAVNETPDQDFVRVVSRCIDLRQFVVYLATEQFVADYDGFLGRVFGMNNMYWYRFASGDPFVLIPWDRDGAFGWAATPIFEGVEENVLAHRALQDPELHQLYLASLAKAIELAGGPGGWLEQELERLYSQLRDIAHADPHKQCSVEGSLVACTGEDFERGIENLREFVRLRADYVLSEAREAGYDPSLWQKLPHVESVNNAASNEAGVAALGLIASLYGERLATTTAEAP